MGHRRWLMAGVAVAVVAGLGVVAEDKPAAPALSLLTSLPAIPPELHAALQARDAASVQKQIAALLEEGKHPAPDYLMALLGRSQTEAGELDAALRTYLTLEEKYPQSRWLARSRFGRAVILVRQRNFQAAGAIYRAEIERLLSSGRRDDLAGIYLEFGEKFFLGEKPESGPTPRPPDYAKALPYYQQALQLAPSLKRRQHTEVRIARCLQESGQHGEAISAFRQFLAVHAGERTAADKRAEPALELEARYELGRTHLAAGQPAEARKVWQDLIASPLAKEPGGDPIAEATYRIAHTYSMPAPNSTGDLELGVAAAERFLAAFAAHKLAATAQLEIAQAYMHFGRHPQAVAELKKLIANPQFAGQPQVAQARSLLGQAYAGQKQYAEAIAAWQDFLQQHPNDARWSEVQRTIVDTEFVMAADERDERRYDAARKLWETFLNKYPLDGRAAGVLFEFGRMKFLQGDELAKASPVDKAAVQARYEEAIADWQKVVAKYPDTAEASQAAFNVGVTLEDKLGRLNDALEAYRKVTGPVQPEAQHRIAVLTEKQLSVVTERKFRTNEPARIKVSTRNVESLTVKIYRIDLADYFRKMHLATGVEALDIALIDADKSWEEKVGNYEKYRRVENEITIPLEGPGVTAVTVSSEKLEATTMVVVSDIDVIVKSSRNELFVFAENMVSGSPAAGVTLLISDGHKVFAEEVTGQDGVLQKSYKDLESAVDLRVFAVLEGHTASTIFGLNGLDFATGLSAKGYLFTDRPAYRAGQPVHIKAFVRWTDGDRYVFKDGEKYSLQVFDPRGRLLHSAAVALNGFGTAGTHFVLPPTAPQGDYRIHLYQPGGSQSYETTFSVQEYRLEPVRLSVDLPKKVYFRGETIRGKISLRYYYGSPLAGKTVQYRLHDDDRIHEGTTDANGEVAFEFPTQRFSEEMPLVLGVTFPERSLNHVERVYLATRGFAIGVSTLRGVYMSGESFDATLQVADPGGKPVSTALKLEVLERTNVNGKRGERLAATFDNLKSDDKGTARQTVRIESGGEYLLRASAVDQFQNPVSGSHELFISGEKDETRLRILADAQHYKVGDQAGVTLLWREAPALALVTYEGAKILGYRLIPLQTGANRIDLPMSADLAPNFDLAVSVMQQNKFYDARSEFRVSRKLQIALVPDRTELKPGETLNVEVTAADPQGKPVSAEIALGLIQKNLLEMYSDRQPNVEEFFAGGYRAVSVRSLASNTFRYEPATRGISAALLAESERVLREEQNEAALGALRLQMDLGIAEAAKQLANDLDEAAAANAPPANRPQSSTATERRAGLRRKSEAGFGQTLSGGAPGADGRPQGGELFDRTRDAEYDDANALGDFTSVLRADADHNGLKEAYFGRQVRFFESGKDFLAFDGVNMANGTVHSLNAISRDGRQFALSYDNYALQADLVAGGFQVTGPVAETAFWDPAVVTNAEGKATIKIVMPERSTAWTLRAKGIDAATLAGQTESAVTTRKNLFGEIKTPLAFTQGDKADLPVEIHHAEVPADKKAAVRLKVTIGEKSTEQTRSLDIASAGVTETVFSIDVGPGEQALLELTVSAGDAKDTSVAAVPVQPYGLPVFATRSGSSSQNTTAFVGHDPALNVQNPSLEILVGPSLNRTLLEAVLGGGPAKFEPTLNLPASEFERAVSDVLGGVAVLGLLGQSRDSGTPEVQGVVLRVQGGLAQLISGQRDDGGWTWSGRIAGDRPDAALSSRVVWALAAARRAGFAVPQDVFDRGVSFLQSSFANLPDGMDETRTVVLHGLAEAGAADFAQANRLYRNRNSLSASGLAHLALTMVRLDRKNLAGDLVPLLAAKLPVGTTGSPMPAAADDSLLKGVRPWMASGVEVRALFLAVLNEVEPTHAAAPRLVESLLAARQGMRWSPEKANGPAVVALAGWFGRSKTAQERYRLAIYVNEKLVETLEIESADAPTRRVEVPARFLTGDGKPQKINFDIEGRGTFSYSAVMSGFVPADKLKKTTDQWRVTRVYQPAPRRLDGEEIPRGWGILDGAYTTFRNELTQLPLGEQGEVTLNVYRNQVPANALEETLDYLVLVEPIPAGCTVMEGTVQGPFERYEIGAGTITFYLGNRVSFGSIRYSLAGYLPGTYRTMPSVVRSFYQPERIAVSEPRELSVLARGAASADKYRLTPVELFEIGKRHVARGRHAEAGPLLTELFNNYTLRAEAYQETVRLLFEVARVENKSDDIVRFFEIIKERFPAIEMPFETILQVAGAYQELGEYERGYLVYRATAEASFYREAQIAGFLDEQGEFVRSVEVMERLLREYPEESYVATATYALAQEIYGRAGEVAARPALKLTRPQLLYSSLAMLEAFLSTWPSDPAADQASFSLANLLLDLEQYDKAIERCELFANRFPQSKLLDSFWYVIGYSQFARGQHEAALATCKRVAEYTRKDPETGAMLAAANKQAAIYIMGQIHHSLGRPAEAIAEYERVKGDFADAVEAIDFFTKKAISWPEVTTVKPADPVKVQLQFRNIAEANLKVYKIDLLKFGLLQRDLNRITAINLAGIRPYHELNLRLGDGKDYRNKTHDVELPLKDEGAYLVVCRGENLYTSGLVLVSPLGLEIQEDESGRVRVTVKDTTTDSYLHKVHVKVIGTANSEFVSGDTDLRGVFIADAINGVVTVIARTAESRYAFYRGKYWVGPPPAQPQQQVEQMPASGGRGARGRTPEAAPAEALLKQLKDSNSSFNNDQRENYQRLLKNRQQGVDSKSAY